MQLIRLNTFGRRFLTDGLATTPKSPTRPKPMYFGDQSDEFSKSLFKPKVNGYSNQAFELLKKLLL